MRRPLIICLLALATALVATAATTAATGTAPTINRVQPMRVTVGQPITITGTHFNAQRRLNTVIFRSPDGRITFAKPRRATAKKLVVQVPAGVSRLLDESDTGQLATRFKLRVLTDRFGKFTPQRLSPVVTAPAVK